MMYFSLPHDSHLVRTLRPVSSTMTLARLILRWAGAFGTVRGYYHAQRVRMREYNTNRPHSTLDDRFHGHRLSQPLD